MIKTFPLIILLSFGTGLIQAGCSLAQTRPVQEMSNAEIALQAAKDLNADSLVPDLFRSASDHYFKAKKEYRLKNFDKAKFYATKSMKLSEKAEFEAYKLGGATPEISSGLVSPEGSSTDSEKTFKEHQQKDGDNMPNVELQNAPPEGQTGPLPTPRQATIVYPAPIQFPDKVLPQTGSLPASVAGVPQSIVSPMNSPALPPTTTSIRDYDYQLLQNRQQKDIPPNNQGEGLPDLATTSIPDLPNDSLKGLYDHNQ